ncbi:MAG: trigger factor [Actinobacteria bacterium]|nr:trigger factor [Actinomycetota bacterium]
MAQKEESASSSAEQTAQKSQVDKSDLPENNVTVEEIGPSRVRIKIEVPPERIESRLDKDLEELRHTAAVPGFRVGRAPRKLIEKRFGSDARDRLKNVLVAESLQEAIEGRELKTLGDPQLDFDKIELPEEGPLTFEVETDIEPAFDLPELEGVAVTKPAVAVEDKDVDAAIKTMLAREGVYEPVTGTAKKGDQVIGDLWLKVGDKEITRRDDMALFAGPTEMALMSVKLNDLCEKFVSAKVGSEATAEVAVGEDHPDEEIRGKKGTVGLAVKEIKRLKVPSLTGEWLKKAGFESEQEFRSMVKNNLQQQAEQRTAENMRGQLRDYLLSRTTLELPEKLSAEQAERGRLRQVVRLMQMGIPEQQAHEVVDKKAEETRNQALDETKMFFILNRIAGEYEIEVDDAEVNGQIAGMAAMYGQRPEKMRQQLAQSGRLGIMANQIREQKVLDKLLSQAKITEAKPEKPKPKKSKPKKEAAPKAKQAAKPKESSKDEPAAKSAKPAAKKAKKATKKES